MKKKYFAVFMLLILFINMIPPKVSAVGGAVMSRVVKGSVGERVLVGLAEKGGIKWVSKEQQERFTEYWNKELAERARLAEQLNDQVKVTELHNLQNTLANMTDNDIGSKSGGFGKALLNAGLFVTGLDLVYEIVDGIRQANEMEEFKERMVESGYNPESSERVTGFGSISFFTVGNENVVGTSDNYVRVNRNDLYGGLETYLPWITNDPYTISEWNQTKLVIPINYYYRYEDYKNSRDIQEFGNVTKTLIFPKDFIFSSDSKTVSSIPKSSDVPERRIIGLPTPSEIETSFPDGIEITVPDSSDYIVDNPWNEPITIPDSNPNPDPDPQPEPNPDLNPQPEDSPLPNGDGTEIPTEQLPPSDNSCQSPATTVLEFLKNWIIGNFACFDWDKLKMAGGFFTNKFPFSLPWDVGRAIDAVFGGLGESDTLPEFPIKVGEWEGVIRIPEFFHDWFPILRIMILVMFDISLIYAVRKLLGGAS